MKDLKEIQEALSDAGPGTIVMVRGYENSKGEKRDLEVELAPGDGYHQANREDLEILLEADVGDLGDLHGPEDSGDLKMTDLIAARDQLIQARKKSIEDRVKKQTRHIGPDYIPLGPSIAKHPEDDTSLYIRGSRAVDEVPEPKPAKGAIPRAKQKLAAALDLPTRRFIHNIKLAPGKFDDVTVFEKPAEQ